MKHMEFRIDKPVLNRRTDAENIAIIDKWISDTADKLNIFISEVNKERRNSDVTEEDRQN